MVHNINLQGLNTTKQTIFLSLGLYNINSVVPFGIYTSLYVDIGNDIRLATR